MLEKFKKFMMGRYGVDQLSNGLNFIFLLFVIIGLLSKKSLFLFLALVPMIYNYYRMFSKNFSKRYNENRIYTNIMAPYYNWLEKLSKKLQKYQNRDHKNYKYFTCKSCKQELRIPKGKGKVTITCPRCKHSFDGRS